MLKVRPGRRYPPGATPDSDGVNFSVFSSAATAVELLLYEGPDSAGPFQVIELQPEVHRTFFFWHVYVEGLRPGVWFTWRVDGPDDTAQSGLRFDRKRELLDPWCRGVSDALWHRRQACDPATAGGTSMRARVLDEGGYDWQGDVPLDLPTEGMVIYELHVRGFTRHPGSGVKAPGTFSGLAQKIPYLKRLGITHVELMPVMAFDSQDVPPGVADRGLSNYWGYSTHSFFSPHPGLCQDPLRGRHRREFRDMVKALHRAGIGVVLDVVFNHTAEAGADGPTLNFKGLANNVFYHLDAADRTQYRDFTGCGNTMNCNHPVVSNFIIDALEYWVREMHVDGFRFDLASALSRGEDGEPLHNAPVLWGIEFSDTLALTKIIAEAWDASGLYQVGAFPGCRWAEWNGRYRDVVRRFVRGDAGVVSELATRLAGSSDLYQARGRLPINSINFITCHDGFTLSDLVSYEQKHNWGNGEDNRDGLDDNLSWNCGVEGPTNDAEVLALRQRQARNFLTVLFLSQGVPMLLAGDEVLRTQKGNNNAYCQDNELSWFDWSLVEANRPMLRFARHLIAFRRRHPCLMRRRFLTGRAAKAGEFPDIAWHGTRLGEPPWNDPDARHLAFTLGAREDGEEHIHVMLNMSDGPLRMAVPLLKHGAWHLAIDTSRPSPRDIAGPGSQRPVTGDGIAVPAHSVVVLEGRAPV